MVRSGPMTLVSSWAYISSSVSCSIGDRTSNPALLTSTSIDAASASAASTDGGSLTSSRSASRSSGRPRSTAASRSLDLPEIAHGRDRRRGLWRARVSAASRPKPLLEPVMRMRAMRLILARRNSTWRPAPAPVASVRCPPVPTTPHASSSGRSVWPRDSSGGSGSPHRCGGSSSSTSARSSSSRWARCSRSSVLLGETPTGVVADMVSRRRSLVIGQALMGLAFIWAVVSTNYWVILPAQALFGIGWTFRSGAPTPPGSPTS